VSGTPPSDWEIRAVVKSLIEADSDLIDWLGGSIVVVEYNSSVEPSEALVAIDVARVIPERLSCPKFDLLFDVHVFSLSANSANANEELARIERILELETGSVEASVSGWGDAVVANIMFEKRLGQAPANQGWSVASAFSALTYYN